MTADPESAAAVHHGLDRRMLTFFGILAAMFLGALDQTIVGTALPRIVADLRGLDRYSWVVTAYLLTSTAVMAIVGKLSGQLGRKRVVLGGIVLFVAASAVCGAAQDMTQLIVFRGVQGIGAGVIMGTAFVVIADLFSPAERGRYTGFLSAVFGLSAIVGPLVGGYLTDNLSWRWVFYVNLPVGIIVFLGLWLTFPSLRLAEAERPRIDYVGAVGVAAAAALLTIGASRAGGSGWGDTGVIALLLSGVLLLAVLPFYEARVAEAILPPQMFRSSIFAISTLIAGLLGVAMFSSIIYIPLFLQGVVGVTALVSGEAIWPLMFAMVLSSIFGGILLSRTGKYRIQAVVGMGLMSAGLYLMTVLDVHSTQLEVARNMIVFGLGLGITFPVLNVVAQNAVPQRFIGPAVSSMQFVRAIGATLGVAVFGSIVNQELRDKTAANLPASTLARVPAQFRGFITQLENPQVLFGSGLDQILARVPVERREAFLQVVGTIKSAVKIALAQSLHTVFVDAMILSLVATVAALFIKEIPLRKTMEQPQRPPAPREAVPESVLV